MTDAEILDTTFRSALALPPDTELAAIAYGRPETWDSVAHMELVVALEEAFGIALDPDDVVAMSSYAAACRLLRDHHGLAIDR